MGRRYRRPVKKSPRSDPQQYRVYRMESEAIGCGAYVRMRLSEIRRFARAVCRSYRMPSVKVKFAKLGRWAAEWEAPNIIRMNPKKEGSLNLIVIAHELAHHLHNYLAGDLWEQEAHGPQFMACYMSILDAGRIIPVVGMREICRRYKVKFVDPGNKAALLTLKRRVRKRVPRNKSKKKARAG